MAVFPRSFSYVSASSLGEAIELLEKYGDEAKILAGGHSLVPLMKLRLASPQYIIDISGIKDGDYIREADGALSIGALTTHHSIETSDQIKEKCGIMAEAASQIGDPQIRNAGTIGGALAHADPSGDWGAVILALNGEFKVRGPTGERIIGVDQFFSGMFETALKPNEILTEIRVPIPPQPKAGAYKKLERKIGDFATVGVAVQLNVAGNTISDADIGLTAVGSTPVRAVAAEDQLKGKAADETVIEAAGKAASEVSEPTADLRGSVEYKKAMVLEFTKRAITQALERAK